MPHLELPGSSNNSKSQGRDLPPNVWVPSDVTSMKIYWQFLGEGYEVAVQLIDESIAQDDLGIIVWSLIDSDHPAIPFSLHDFETGQIVLGGRIEWIDPSYPSGPQLWIKDARYPGGGHTAAAQIA